MYILSDLKEHTGHSGVLADRDLFRVRDFKILNNVIKNSFRDFSILAGAAAPDRFLYVLRKMLVCRDAEPLHRVCNLAHIYFPHITPPP